MYIFSAFKWTIFLSKIKKRGRDAMFKIFNENSCGLWVGDCVVRAVSILTDQNWDDTYMDLALQGFRMCNMPSANVVWGQYLIDKGYEMYSIKPTTVKEFCKSHPNGKYLLATGSHVIAIIDGDYYDAWDSGNELIIYYFTKEV